MSYNIYCVALNSESTLPRKKNPSKGLPKMHPSWKGEQRKPREVMTIKHLPRRSRGVWAGYCKAKKDKNGKWVLTNEDRPR